MEYKSNMRTAKIQIAITLVVAVTLLLLVLFELISTLALVFATLAFLASALFFVWLILIPSHRIYVQSTSITASFLLRQDKVYDARGLYRVEISINEQQVHMYFPGKHLRIYVSGESDTSHFFEMIKCLVGEISKSGRVSPIAFKNEFDSYTDIRLMDFE